LKIFGTNFNLFTFDERPKHTVEFLLMLINVAKGQNDRIGSTISSGNTWLHGCRNLVAFIASAGRFMADIWTAAYLVGPDTPATSRTAAG